MRVIQLLGEDLMIHSYQLFEITEGLERLEHAKTFVAEELASGALKPVIAKTYRLDQFADAHRCMETNEQVGKIVVTV